MNQFISNKLLLFFFKYNKNIYVILVTGSLAFDLIMDFQGSFAENIDPNRIHILNLSFLVDSLKKERGGTAGNIAYSLALLNMPVSILGCAGEDFDRYNHFLQENGIDTANIKIIENEFTAQAFIVTDKKDNQISAFYPGAMKHPIEPPLAKLTDRPSFVVISPNPSEVMLKLARQCRQLKIPYMFDPGMQLPRMTDNQLKEGIKSAKILIGNDYEIGLIKSRLKLTDNQILKQVEILITTFGEKGSVIKTKDQEIVVKAAKPKKVLDPTGAGDAYRSGFLAGLLKGLDLQTCGNMGGVASCYAVEKYGTTNHRFSVSTFCQRYKENFRTTLSL